MHNSAFRGARILVSYIDSGVIGEASDSPSRQSHGSVFTVGTECLDVSDSR